MTPEQRMEELSRAYLYAVTAACGFAVGNWSQDQDCIDATVGAAGVLGEGHLADPKLDIQLKATANPAALRGDHLALQVRKHQYERLRKRSMVPKLLVALALPENDGQWVEVTPQMLILRHCAWYTTTSDLEPISGQSRVVKLPFTQQFTPAALRTIMERLSRGEAP